MFRKILIANRGEIAVRIIRACREMGIRTVAVYSEADEDAMHVRLADEAVCIGPAAPSASYLDMDRLISTALATKAEAIHPGFGFLSENADFAEKCAKFGITFIGPSGELIDKMGNKSEAKHTMKEAGIPVVPGTDSPVYEAGEALSLRLSDGLRQVSPAEAQDVVIAGMGGELILRIVGETPWLRDSSKRLILQPMSSVPQLRSGLADLGYSIIQEEAVVDGGKVYSAFTAQFSGSPVETGPLYSLMGKLRPGAPQVDRYAQKVLRSLESQRQGALHQGRMDQAASLETFIRQIQTTYLPSPGGSS